jgi:hypothetical protein
MDNSILATLLGLAARARHSSSLAELAFILVNETHGLLPYRQSVLFTSEGGVLALSGVASPEENAPFVLWIKRLIQKIPTSKQPVLLDQYLVGEVGQEWNDWLPQHALWVPLTISTNENEISGLLLAREDPWNEAELPLLSEWADIWQHAYRHLNVKKRRWWHVKIQSESNEKWFGHPRIKRNFVIGLALLLIGFLPVKLSVLAPGELIPQNPSVIRASLDGVVNKVLVLPNQMVKKDQSLFEYDLANLESRLAVARQALASAQADYRVKAQRAVFDSESKAQLSSLESHINERRAEVSYLLKLNQRGVVESPRAGIVMFGDANELIGRPVSTGERIMVVADPLSSEIEAWLSLGDAIDLTAGDDLTLYLNADPLSPISAKLYYIAYESIERPDGTYAYRIRGKLNKNQIKHHVGLKGTAKIQGNRVPLIYWVFRRPVAGIRTWLGI